MSKIQNSTKHFKSEACIPAKFWIIFCLSNQSIIIALFSYYAVVVPSKSNCSKHKHRLEATFHFASCNAAYTHIKQSNDLSNGRLEIDDDQTDKLCIKFQGWNSSGLQLLYI